jgi:hypothetical protein
MGKGKGKDKTPEPTSRNELGTLAPKPVVWDIGGIEFEQKPLRIDQLSDVMEEITDIVLGQGRGALLDQLVDATAQGDASQAIGQATMPILVRTLVGIPRRLQKIVSMILLDADEEHLTEHMGARLAIQIVKVFIEQNEIGALIQDFFGLVSSINLSVDQAT